MSSSCAVIDESNSVFGEDEIRSITPVKKHPNKYNSDRIYIRSGSLIGRAVSPINEGKDKSKGIEECSPTGTSIRGGQCTSAVGNSTNQSNRALPPSTCLIEDNDATSLEKKMRKLQLLNDSSEKLKYERSKALKANAQKNDHTTGNYAKQQSDNYAKQQSDNYAKQQSANYAKQQSNRILIQQSDYYAKQQSSKYVKQQFDNHPKPDNYAKEKSNNYERADDYDKQQSNYTKSDNEPSVRKKTVKETIVNVQNTKPKEIPKGVVQLTKSVKQRETVTEKQNAKQKQAVPDKEHGKPNEAVKENQQVNKVTKQTRRGSSHDEILRLQQKMAKLQNKIAHMQSSVIKLQSRSEK